MGMLKPDYYCNTVFDIPYGELWQRGIRGLIFDIDNTIAPYAENYPSPKIVALMKRIKGMGFKISLLTNNTNKRLDCFTKPLELTGRANAAKPFARGIRKLMIEQSTPTTHTAIIGDQLLSDIWAGKNARITTILVKPLSDKDFAFVRIKRMIEGRLLKRYYGNTQ